MAAFHMIGARGVESAILDGYAEHVRQVHTDTPVPDFYLGERLFANAPAMRAKAENERFFDDLLRYWVGVFGQFWVWCWRCCGYRVAAA